MVALTAFGEAAGISVRTIPAVRYQLAQSGILVAVGPAAARARVTGQPLLTWVLATRTTTGFGISARPAQPRTRDRLLARPDLADSAVKIASRSDAFRVGMRALTRLAPPLAAMRRPLGRATLDRNGPRGTGIQLRLIRRYLTQDVWSPLRSMPCI